MLLKHKIIYHMYNIKYSYEFQRHIYNRFVNYHMNNDLVIGYHIVKSMLEEEYGTER